MDTSAQPLNATSSLSTQLRVRLDPIAGVLQRVFQRLRQQRAARCLPGARKTLIAAASFVQQGLARVLVNPRSANCARPAATSVFGGGIQIINAALSSRNAAYAAYLARRLQRHGYHSATAAAGEYRPQSPPAWSRSAMRMR